MHAVVLLPCLPTVCHTQQCNRICSARFGLVRTIERANKVKNMGPSMMLDCRPPPHTPPLSFFVFFSTCFALHFSSG